MSVTQVTQYKVVNPATGETVEEFPTATDDQILDALERSDQAFKTWRETPIQDRTAVLRRVADIYEQRSEELAKIIQLEMGKAIPEGQGELQLVSLIYRYFADNAEAF